MRDWEDCLLDDIPSNPPAGPYSLYAPDIGLEPPGEKQGVVGWTNNRKRKGRYRITHSITFDNGRGFALGQCNRRQGPYLLWQFTECGHHRKYYFAITYYSLEQALHDLGLRAASYERLYGVMRLPGSAGWLPELMKPIAKEDRHG